MLSPAQCVKLNILDTALKTTNSGSLQDVNTVPGVVCRCDSTEKGHTPAHPDGHIRQPFLKATRNILPNKAY